MPELSRSQLLVYGAIAVALLLLGARWLRSADASTSAGFGGVARAAPRSARSSSSAGDGDVVVHVAGAVAQARASTGSRRGSRVTDAVERAGGADRDAPRRTRSTSPRSSPTASR